VEVLVDIQEVAAAVEMAAVLVALVVVAVAVVEAAMTKLKDAAAAAA